MNYLHSLSCFKPDFPLIHSNGSVIPDSRFVSKTQLHNTKLLLLLWYLLRIAEVFYLPWRRSSYRRERERYRNGTRRSPMFLERQMVKCKVFKVTFRH